MRKRVVKQTDAVSCGTTSPNWVARPDGTRLSPINGKNDEERWYLDFTSADFVHVSKFENGRRIEATSELLPYKTVVGKETTANNSVVSCRRLPSRNLCDIRENFEMPSSSDGVYRAVPVVVSGGVPSIKIEGTVFYSLIFFVLFTVSSLCLSFTFSLWHIV